MLNIKSVSLSLLCVVMTAQAVVMHISRTDRDPGVPPYKPAAAVILTELGKLLVSAVLAWRECRSALQGEEAQKRIGVEDSNVRARMISNNSSIIEERETQEEEEKQGLLSATSAVSSLSSPTTLEQPSESSSSGSPLSAAVLQRMKEDTFGPDWMKLSIPAMLFTGQSNLAYYASSNLSVPVFQITYQLKIPATALCSVLMLRRSLSRLQWFSIALLSLGVGVVQLASSHADAKYHVHSSDTTSISGVAEPLLAAGTKDDAIWQGRNVTEVIFKRAVETTTAAVSAMVENGKAQVVEMNQMLGLIAVVLACLSSGFSGVYFERVLKKKALPVPITSPFSSSPSSAPSSIIIDPPPPARKTGLWIRNIQLSLFSLLVGSVIYLATSPLDTLPSFLEGFTPIVYILIGMQITGGLLAAVVIQYADNIAKSFSASCSIILSFVASVWLFDYRLNGGVVAGSGLVMGATWLFNYTPSPKKVADASQSLLPQNSPRAAESATMPSNDWLEQQSRKNSAY